MMQDAMPADARDAGCKMQDTGKKTGLRFR